MLPMRSTLTVSPAASHHCRNRSRPRRSSSVSVWRLTPPAAVAPISAILIRLCQSRSPSTRSSVILISPVDRLVTFGQLARGRATTNT